jgi:hypothetical protein
MDLNFMDEDNRDNIEIGINYLYKEIKKKNPRLFYNINENIIVLIDIFHFYFDNLDFDKYKSTNNVFMSLINKKFAKYNNINIYINNIKINNFLLENINKNNKNQQLSCLPIIFSQIIKKVLDNKTNKIKYLYNILRSNDFMNIKIIADQIDISNQIKPVNYNLTMNMIIYHGFYYNINNNIFINNDSCEVQYILGLNGTFSHFSNLIFDLLQFDTSFEKLLKTSNCNDFYYILFKKVAKNKNKNILTYFFGIPELYVKDYNDKDISEIKSMREMFQYFSNIFEKYVSNNKNKNDILEVDYTLIYNIFKKKKLIKKKKLLF